jgi:PadR family transcriptional regulator PadR
MKLERELMRGAGPTAVMQLLSAGEKYGYELVEALSRQSNGVLGMGQSTLYPMLYNLEAKGLIRSRLDESGPRPRRFYRLTGKGEKKLTADTKQWQALWEALRSLGVVGQPAASAAGGVR